MLLAVKNHSQLNRAASNETMPAAAKNALNEVLACHILLLAFHGQFARTVFLLFDGDAYRVARQQFFYQFRPFDEAKRSAIEVVFIPHVIHFLQLLDAIEVEVVNQFAGYLRTIFVDDGEGRRGDYILNPPVRGKEP